MYLSGISLDVMETYIRTFIIIYRYFTLRDGKNDPCSPMIYTVWQDGFIMAIRLIAGEALNRQ